MQEEQRPVRVVTDSAADIPAALAQELGITVIPLRVHIGAKTYLDGVELSGPQFYRELTATHSVTTTSLPSLESFSDAYRRLTNEGYGVVSVHISSKLSGTFNAALMASTADGVESDAVCVVDSRSVTMAEGWVAIEAAEAARQGKTLEEVEAVAQAAARGCYVFGALGTLEYVIRSGRVGRLPGTIGTMLHITPILTIQRNGEAQIMERARSRKRALERIVELTGELGPLGGLAVMHGSDEEGAAQLLEMLRPLDPPQPVIVSHIGAVLGTHVGPGAVGVCCVKHTGR